VARSPPPTSRHIATPSRGAVAMASVDVVADALERLEDAGVDAARGADARALAAWARGEARRDDGDDDARVALARACAAAMRRAGGATGDADALVDGARASGDDADAREAFVDALRRCATTLQVTALETAARAAREGGEKRASASERAREDAMDADETGERAVRAIERLASGLEDAASKSTTEVLDAATARATATLRELPENHARKVLDASSWTNAQRELIERVERALHDEYKARREMVAKRAQVTTTSLCYSARLNALKDVREEFARRVVSELHVAPQVTMDDVCDARYADLAVAGIKVTAGSDGLQSAVKKVLMGSVPDRGGRTDGSDRAAMPAFAARTDAPSGGRGGGGRGGGGDKPKPTPKPKKKGAVRW